MESSEFQLGHYLRILWKGKWLILLTTLVATVGVIAFARRDAPPPPFYKASATIMTQQAQTPSLESLGNLGALAAVAGERSLAGAGAVSANTQIQLIESRNVLRRALDKLQPVTEGEKPPITDADIETLRASIGVSAIAGTNLLEIRASAPTPELAQQRANAVVEAYVDYLKAEETKTIKDALENVTRQLRNVDQTEELGNQAVTLLPRLGVELNGLLQTLEQSAQTMRQAQAQLAAAPRPSPLQIEKERLASASNELEDITRDLQSVREGLQDSRAADPSPLQQPADQIKSATTALEGISVGVQQIQQQLAGSAAAPAGAPSLLAEASRLDKAAATLDSLAQKLQDAQSQGQASDPRQDLADKATQLNDLAGSLQQASKRLEMVIPKLPYTVSDGATVSDQEQATTLQREMTALVSSLQNTAAELQKLGATKEPTPEASAPVRDQIQVQAVALSVVAQKLSALRRPDTDSTTYGELTVVESRIQDTATQLEAMTRDLSAPSVAQEADLQNVQLRLRQGSASLKTVAQDLRAFSPRSGVNAERDALLERANNRLAEVSLALDVAARQLDTASRASSAGPLFSAQLSAWNAQLLAPARSDVEGVISRLSLEQQGQPTMAAQLEVIRSRLDTNILALSATQENLQTQLGAAASAPAPDSAARLRDEVNLTLVSLDIALRQLRGLLVSAPDPLLSGELGSLADQFTAARLQIENASAQLDVIAQNQNGLLAEQLGLVQERVQQGATTLQAALVSLGNVEQTADLDAITQAARQAHDEVNKVALGLDIASRQLSRILEGNRNPILTGEMASLAQRITSAQTAIQGITGRLATLTPQTPDQEFQALQEGLRTAQASLRQALTAQQSVSGDATPGTALNAVLQVKDQVDITAAILTQVAAELSGLKGQEADLTLYGQLVLLEGRVIGARERAGELGTQLHQLQSSQGPGYLRLIQLQQQLQLSLLQPQETGVSMVDSAVVPQITESSRDKLFSKVRIPLGALAGLLLGVLAVVGRAQLDQTARTQRQLRDKVGLNILGILPRSKTPRNQATPLIANQKSPTFLEALQLLSANLLGTLGKGPVTLLITSAGAKEGKTTLAVNLAQGLAQHGRRVLLIDANLRKPDLARALQQPAEGGLAAALSHQEDPLDYVVTLGPYAVLAGGSAVANPVELLSSPAMQNFLEKAGQKYDTILLDGPPTLGFAETHILERLATHTLLVVRSGANAPETLAAARDALQAVGVKMVGATLNMAPDEECGHLKHHGYTEANVNGSKFRLPAWPRRQPQATVTMNDQDSEAKAVSGKRREQDNLHKRGSGTLYPHPALKPEYPETPAQGLAEASSQI